MCFYLEVDFFCMSIVVLDSGGSYQKSTSLKFQSKVPAHVAVRSNQLLLSVLSDEQRSSQKYFISYSLSHLVMKILLVALADEDQAIDIK